MKKMLCTLLTLALLLLPAMGLADTGSLLTVQGRASVMVVPDIAALYFGVTATDEDAMAAQSSVNAVNADAIAAIKALGIDEAAITTDSISIRTEYDYSGELTRVIGFTASTQLCVMLDDISLAGQVIDAALGAGMNNVRDIQFSTSRHGEHYDQALSTAMQNALHKAGILASAAGMEIESIHSITEEYSSGMYTLRTEAGMDMMASAAGINSTTIASGEIEVQATVTAVFDLK